MLYWRVARAFSSTFDSVVQHMFLTFYTDSLGRARGCTCQEEIGRGWWGGRWWNWLPDLTGVNYYYKLGRDITKWGDVVQLMLKEQDEGYESLIGWRSKEIFYTQPSKEICRQKLQKRLCEAALSMGCNTMWKMHHKTHFAYDQRNDTSKKILTKERCQLLFQ